MNNLKDLYCAALARLNYAQRRFRQLQKELVAEEDRETRIEITRQMAIVAQTIANEKALIECIKLKMRAH
jgi:hypothetical protein